MNRMDREAYGRRPDNLTAYGSCCIVMTTGDLVTWVLRFMTGEVGGREVVEPMQQDVVKIAEWDRLAGYGYGLEVWILL